MLDYAKLLLDSISKAISRPHGRALRHKERVLQTGIEARFDYEKESVVRRSAVLFTKAFKRSKGLTEDIDTILQDLDDEELLAVIRASAEDALAFGAENTVYDQNLGSIGISFSIQHPLVRQYLAERGLIWSKINQTTKDLIKPILIQAAESGQSYNVTAKQIRDSFAFSKSRSLMIATNEIGNAYEHGNYMMMKEVNDRGFQVTKQWRTVHDDRVTVECNAYERLGWIPFTHPFTTSGLSDDRAPRQSNPRCRCTTLYRYK